MTTSTPAKSAVRRSNVRPSACRICLAPALYSYCGVVSCYSCKMFFKRNAESKKTSLQCHYTHHCQINIDNRHTCSACRLAKCFAVGMKTRMIRSCHSHKHRRNSRVSTALVRAVEIDHPHQFPILNLLQSEQSTLSAVQWVLLSNLVHCYDEYGALSAGERFLREQNSLPVKFRFKMRSIVDMLVSLISGARRSFESNRDFVELCSHDRSVLLHSSMKHVASVDTAFVLRQTRLLDNPAFVEPVKMAYGITSVNINQRLVNQLDPDEVFIKLVLAIVAFSTTNCVFHPNLTLDNLTNIQTILRIQDMYIELTWRYLLYKYNHDHAVRSFNNIIRCLFISTEGIAESHKIQPDSVIQQTEQSLTLDS